MIALYEIGRRPNMFHICWLDAEFGSFLIDVLIKIRRTGSLITNLVQKIFWYLNLTLLVWNIQNIIRDWDVQYRW